MQTTHSHETGDTSPQMVSSDQKQAAPALNGETGAGLAEYALLLLLVAIPCIIALTAIRGALVNAFQQAAGMF